MKKRSFLLALIPVASLIGACANDLEPAKPATPAYLEKDYTAFRERLRACTTRTGYDPAAQQSLGAYQLGRGELAWRDCAYAALRATIVPATTHPELYLALIEQDKALTAGIRERRVTRAQREAQIAQQRERILAHEENAGDRLQAGLTERERERRREFLMRSTRDLLYGLPTSPTPRPQ
ncbi:MAG TPA: hypothetical protein VIF14_18685 [Alphaproteobacteria bacterium]|jgi:hypothetical protein